MVYNFLGPISAEDFCSRIYWNECRIVYCINFIYVKNILIIFIQTIYFYKERWSYATGDFLSQPSVATLITLKIKDLYII